MKNNLKNHLIINQFFSTLSNKYKTLNINIQHLSSFLYLENIENKFIFIWHPNFITQFYDLKSMVVI
jgi:hypothetical protein